MKTVILCGGKGTRLREYTEAIPKPLIEIGGRPILWHIMKIYASFGMTDFILALGYKGNMIKKWFLEDKYRGNRNDEGWNITFANTGIDTPTGGRIKKSKKYVDGDTFMVTYGDGVSNININKLVKYHKRIGKKATITCIKPNSQYGIVKLNGNKVSGFEEKPLMKEWVNGGFFVFEPSVLDILRENDVLEGRPFGVLASKEELVAYKHHSFWKCMDTYKDAQNLNELWSKHAPWKIWS